MKDSSLKTQTHARRGFTLTEMSIVLLAASAIIGAVWVAGQHVWDNFRITRANQQIMKVVQSVRDYYGPSGQSFPIAAATFGGSCTIPASGDFTCAADYFNLIPQEMRRNAAAAPGGTAIDHAINNSFGGAAAPTWGSFHVFNVTCPANTGVGSNCFALAIQGLQQTPCVRLLLSAPFTDTSIGIIQVGTQGTSGVPPVTTAITYNAGGTYAGGNFWRTNTGTWAAPAWINFTLPLSSTTAATWCAPSLLATSEVDLVFKLRN